MLFDGCRARPGLRSCARENRRSGFCLRALVKSLEHGRWSPACTPAPRGSWKRLLARLTGTKVAPQTPHLTRPSDPCSPVDSSSKETLNQRYERCPEGRVERGPACGALNLPLAQPLKTTFNLPGKRPVSADFWRVESTLLKVSSVSLRDLSAGAIARGGSRVELSP